MATAYIRNFNQVVTYWARGISDGYGLLTYASPILIMCRWEDKRVLFRDVQARESVSEAIVYVDRQLSLGDYLAQDDQTAIASPINFNPAREVRSLNMSPSLDGTEILYKVIL